MAYSTFVSSLARPISTIGPMTSSNFGRTGFQPGITPTLFRRPAGLSPAISLPNPAPIVTSPVRFEPLKAPGASLPPPPDPYYARAQASARSGSTSRALAQSFVREPEMQNVGFASIVNAIAAITTPISHNVPQGQQTQAPAPVVQTWQQTAINTAIRSAGTEVGLRSLVSPDVGTGPVTQKSQSLINLLKQQKAPIKRTYYRGGQ